jgi:signal peptidase I
MVPYWIYRQKMRVGLYMNGTKAVILALFTAFFIKLLFFDFMIAQGSSMEPAIQNGKILIISRLRYGIRLPLMQTYIVRWANPKTGEVVVFYTPSGEIAVKRCAALDENGFFAEGDNQIVSYDSRSYGFVPIDNIIGKVLGY